MSTPDLEHAVANDSCAAPDIDHVDTPTASDVNSAGACTGCTRRFILRGIAVGAGSAVLAACGTDAGGGEDLVDAPPIDTGVSMCGSNLCIDLSATGAASLTKDNGSALVTLPGDRAVVIRKSATDYIVVSNICTHASCTAHFDGSSKLACPCHGSQFDLTGKVLRGPATRPLRTYAASIDATGTVLTIELG